MALLTFDNSYHRLPEAFYATVLPRPFPSAAVVAFNQSLAASLGITDPNAANLLLASLATGKPLPGAANIALAYAGHQFGHFVPQLGDGRAMLLGEVIAPSGHRWDLQAKGSGPTAFSRRGDGLSAIGPVLREYLVSEAMAAMGVPTTRSLAAFATGEDVARQHWEPGGVLLRIAASHIRVGTFEYFASRSDKASLQKLFAYTCHRHFPDLDATAEPWLGFLAAVAAGQALLQASWLQVGFIHGVMNTDNTALSGETLDYGPCGFLDEYHPDKVFSSIDRGGRYSFSNQPLIARWNLAVLAACLTPLVPSATSGQEVFGDILADFAVTLASQRQETLCLKLGFATATPPRVALAEAFLDLLAQNEWDYTLSFRYLSAAIDQGVAAYPESFQNHDAFTSWLSSWTHELAAAGRDPDAVQSEMQRLNPLYIPRNHLMEEVLQAFAAGDSQPYFDWLKVLQHPFDYQPTADRWAKAPLPHERVQATFCGT